VRSKSAGGPKLQAGHARCSESRRCGSRRR
jgi:hypothetical protein